MFGKGKIEIAIAKTHFAPGDVISGDVRLTMKKPVKAKGISIYLIGEQTTTRGGGLAPAERPKATRVRLYEFKQQLDGEKEYSKGEDYKFEMKIPADILSGKPQMPQIGGKLGKGISIAQAVIGVSTTTKWYLLAKLDVPRGIDIKKEVQITIG
jgi:hypothetical protein